MDEEPWEGFEVNGDDVEPTKNASLVGRKGPKKILQKDGKKLRKKENLDPNVTGAMKRQVNSLGNEFDVLDSEEHNVADGSAYKYANLCFYANVNSISLAFLRTKPRNSHFVK